MEETHAIENCILFVEQAIIQRRIKMRFMSVIAAMITIATSLGASQRMPRRVRIYGSSATSIIRITAFVSKHNGPSNISAMGGATSTMKALSH